MNATSSKKQISSVTPFRELVSFDELNVDIKSDYDFTKNYSQSDCIEDNNTRGHSSKVVSSIHILLSYQVENKKLLNKIKKLQDEKSVLIKWIHFLY